MDNNMYTELILEHYRNPANFGTLKDCNLESYDENPICGDKIRMQFKISNNEIEEIKFSGDGCAICMSSASMLTSHVKGMKLGEAKRVSKDDVFKLLGIELTPVRIKCALLPLKVLKIAIVSFLEENKTVDWNSL